jgi:excisionase family DNA binding protein
MTTPSGQKLLTTRQVADRCGVDVGKIGRWIRSGQLSAVDVAENQGGRPRWRISQEAIEAFLARRQSPPAVTPPKRRATRAAYKDYV